MYQTEHLQVASAQWPQIHTDHAYMQSQTREGICVVSVTYCMGSRSFFHSEFQCFRNVNGLFNFHSHIISLHIFWQITL